MHLQRSPSLMRVTISTSYDHLGLSSLDCRICPVITKWLTNQILVLKSVLPREKKNQTHTVQHSESSYCSLVNKHYVLGFYQEISNFTLLLITFNKRYKTTQCLQIVSIVLALRNTNSPFLLEKIVFLTH